LPPTANRRRPDAQGVPGLLGGKADEIDEHQRRALARREDAEDPNDVGPRFRQLERTPFPLPRLVLADKPVLDQRYDDIALEGYQHHPFIKFPVAV